MCTNGARAGVSNPYCIEWIMKLPKTYIENFIQSQQTGIQYVLPGRHCTPAEKAVQTYKVCFKSTIASLPPEFPISRWSRLIDQVDVSVNSVWPCRQDPRFSTLAACNGDVHFGSTPTTPSVTVMLCNACQA